MMGDTEARSHERKGRRFGCGAERRSRKIALGSPFPAVSLPEALIRPSTVHLIHCLDTTSCKISRAVSGPIAIFPCVFPFGRENPGSHREVFGLGVVDDD